MIFDMEKRNATDLLAVEDSGDTCTYGDAVELAGKCMKLQGRQGKPAVAFLMCSNRIGSLLGYLAFLSADIIPVMLDEKIDTSLLAELTNIYDPKYIWMKEDVGSGTDDSDLGTKDETDDSAKGSGVYGGAPRTGEKDDARNGASRIDKKGGADSDAREDVHPVDTNDSDPRIYEKLLSAHGYALYDTGADTYPVHLHLGLLITTSGSTGSPKLVRQTYGNLESNAKSIAEYLEIGAEDRPITSLPMNYVYGLSVINSHVLKGATILLTDKSVAQKEFWSFFKERGATSFAGVPYTYEILNRLRFTRMELPSLKTMTQAGGRLSEDLQRVFGEYAQGKDIRFYVMYGAAEATSRMAYLPYRDVIRKIGSMGIPIPGGEMRLVRDDGTEVETLGEEGEIFYRGANVMLGYAQSCADLAKEDEMHGELVTGDLARCDEEGYYYIVGRKKRFVKVFGNRVGLDELEKLIRSKYPEKEIAVSGKDDKVCIFIVGGADDIGGGMIAFLESTTKLNRSAFRVMDIDEIPHNDSGKVLYAKLLELI